MSQSDRWATLHIPVEAPVESSKNIKVADAPHAWTITHEYTKQVMTVGGLLFTFSVPFYKEVVGQDPHWVLKIGLFAFWLFLAVAVVVAVYSQALISDRLRGRTEVSDSVVFDWCKIAYYSFIAAIAVMLVVAVVRLFFHLSTPDPKNWATAATEYAQQQTELPAGRFWIAGVVDDERAGEVRYRLAYQHSSKWDFYVVVVNKKTGRPCSFYNKQIPPTDNVE